MQGRVPDPFELVDGLNRRGRERDERERARHHGGRSVGPCAVRMWSSRLRCADGSRRPSGGGIDGKGKARRFEKRPLYPPKPPNPPKPSPRHMRRELPVHQHTPGHALRRCVPNARAEWQRWPRHLHRIGMAEAAASAAQQRQQEPSAIAPAAARHSHVSTGRAPPRDRSAR